ncbi:hypothetical protein COLO4_02699 [Corchorus olitorius]|uniref:Uncharacterized protein n=1 Tax=Corchorus olitorius TaxID=93759 RepID=A0A1R3L0P0_9ROSI|nr:hypothetical protein COLO4_02699 [Corchorus olitorius]
MQQDDRIGVPLLASELIEEIVLCTPSAYG